MNPKLRVIDDAIAWCCRTVLYITLSVVFVILSVNVGLRYAAGTSLRWGSELPELMFPWMIMSGVVLAAQHGSHIAVVILTQKLGAARRWVLHLASWDPAGNTNFALNCEAAKPMLYRPARAYDWAWDMFTAEERAQVQAAMRARVIDAWNSGEVSRGTGHLQRPFGSHANRVWHKLAEAGIAFLDEIPEAPVWLDYAVNKFFACYPVWSDDDGGWHEGVSYWSGYQNKVVWWLQVAQAALGIDGMKKPFFAQVGDYPMYLAPPHSPNAGFGDLSGRPITPAAFLEYHLRARGASGDGGRAGYWRDWAERGGMPANGGFLGFLYRANLPPLPPKRLLTELPPSKVFHGIGVASLTWLGLRDTPARSGPEQWGPMAIAGAEFAADARCTSCHRSGGANSSVKCSPTCFCGHRHTVNQDTLVTDRGCRRCSTDSQLHTARHW